MANFKTTKKILFVGHDASRTGAPILLLHFLRWLKQNSALQFEILLKKGGPLESDFAALAPTKVLKLSFPEKCARKFFERLGWKIPARLSLHFKALNHARRRKIDLVYANTVVVAEEVTALANLGLPVIWHIHELPFIIQAYGGGKPFRKASASPVAYVAASAGVKQALINHYSISEPKIRLIPEFILPVENESQVIDNNRASVRKELALPENAVVAGMCGLAEWRKGADLFITVAKHLATEFPQAHIYMLWIGARTDDSAQIQIDHDIQMAGLTNRLQFIGVKSDSIRYLAALDIFALTSREDPFPLVMLEAASLALPIVCFDHSGGGPEFLEKDTGVIVDYGDTLAMARALVRLSERPDLRRQLGKAAQQKVIDQYTVENQAPKLLQIIEETLQV